MAFTVRGREGRIKVGYQTAARLGSFSLVPVGESQWTVEASVTTADAFWITQRPQAVELTVGKQRWIWAGVSLEIGGGIVRGTVSGRPERR
jgi:hypothetical protein